MTYLLELVKNALENNLTITTDDLETYGTTVKGSFAAAQTLEQQFHFTSTTAKEKYHQALQTRETSWGTFASVEDGQMNGDSYVPFLYDVADFMKARNDYVAGG